MFFVDLNNKEKITFNRQPLKLKNAKLKILHLYDFKLNH